MKRTGALSTLLLSLLLFLDPATAQLFLFDGQPAFDADRYHGLSWRNIGPFQGGRSVAVVGVPGDPLVYYFGSAGGGLWKTTDAGQSWYNISDGYFQSGSIGAIALAPSDPNILYVGTGEHAIRGEMTTHGDGVYKSTNGGESWQHIGLFDSRHIADICVHPHNPDLVYVAVQGARFGGSAERGVFKSDDGGESWRRVLFVDEHTGAADLRLDPHNPRILYAAMWDHQRFPWGIRSGGAGSGLYRSADSGESWEKLTAGLPEAMGKVGIAPSPARPGLVYANIEAAGETGGVYRSNDGGRTWRQCSADRATVTRAWYYMEIEADPRDPETVYILNVDLLRSDDGGATFESLKTPHPDQHDLWINAADPANMILANDGGACISFTGGRSWSTQENQPTGQFYRVIADRQFPYRVYGGQQDFTTVVIPSRTNSEGIDRQDWSTLGGCESASIAFDPEDPRLVFSTCFQGGIYRFDRRTGTAKDVTVYPSIKLGEAPRDHRYRFNWNAPLIVDPHQPAVLYFAGNVVFRSDNRGQHWEAISPDLTRNDSTRQGAGGWPYTNEGAGESVYNTIAYLACSPHRAGTIWAGTDDGRVHRTPDHGRLWEEVTPEGIREGQINAIELSPHDPGTAYLAVTRHKNNDLRPLIYRTQDAGKSWAVITHGIGEEHFVRVVREDPVTPGLLYAGTEGGLYISFDRGANWHRFQRNLPVCPITDLVIADNDLVAATMGRGFWILDDLGALQQSAGQLGRKPQLFRPKPTVRYEAPDPGPPDATRGQNPESGVIIDYYLPTRPDTGQLILTVTDEKGRIVRRYTGRPDCSGQAGTDPCPYAWRQPLPVRPGVNRFNWDLRREPTPALAGAQHEGAYRGSLVGPGRYRITLNIGAEELQTAVEVKIDPRLEATEADFASQQELLDSIDDVLAELQQSVLRVRSVDRQLSALLDRLPRHPGCEALRRRGNALRTEMRNWENQLIQRELKTPQDVIHFPNRLNTELMNLRQRIDAHDPRVTTGACERFNDLMVQWQAVRRQMKRILEEEVAAFNEEYQSAELPVLIVPEK